MERETTGCLGRWTRSTILEERSLEWSRKSANQIVIDHRCSSYESLSPLTPVGKRASEEWARARYPGPRHENNQSPVAACMGAVEIGRAFQETLNRSRESSGHFEWTDVRVNERATLDSDHHPLLCLSLPCPSLFLGSAL